MKDVGMHTSRTLLGFHYFTGAAADWGGKFVVLSKNTWMTDFLSLDDNDPIVETISRLRERPIAMPTDDVSEATPAMPASVKSLETFVCKVYARKAQPGSYPNCAGYFSEQKMFEREMLAPTVRTLIPHVQRVK